MDLSAFMSDDSQEGGGDDKQPRNETNDLTITSTSMNVPQNQQPSDRYDNGWQNIYPQLSVAYKQTQKRVKRTKNLKRHKTSTADAEKAPAKNNRVQSTRVHKRSDIFGDTSSSNDTEAEKPPLRPRIPSETLWKILTGTQNSANTEPAHKASTPVPTRENLQTTVAQKVRSNIQDLQFMLEFELPSVARNQLNVGIKTLQRHLDTSTVPDAAALESTLDKIYSGIRSTMSAAVGVASDEPEPKGFGDDGDTTLRIAAHMVNGAYCMSQSNMRTSLVLYQLLSVDRMQRRCKLEYSCDLDCALKLWRQFIAPEYEDLMLPSKLATKIVERAQRVSQPEPTVVRMVVMALHILTLLRTQSGARANPNVVNDTAVLAKRVLTWPSYTSGDLHRQATHEIKKRNDVWVTYQALALLDNAALDSWALAAPFTFSSLAHMGLHMSKASDNTVAQWKRQIVQSVDSPSNRVANTNGAETTNTLDIAVCMFALLVAAKRSSSLDVELNMFNSLIAYRYRLSNYRCFKFVVWMFALAHDSNHNGRLRTSTNGHDILTAIAKYHTTEEQRAPKTNERRMITVECKRSVQVRVPLTNFQRLCGPTHTIQSNVVNAERLPSNGVRLVLQYANMPHASIVCGDVSATSDSVVTTPFADAVDAVAVCKEWNLHALYPVLELAIAKATTLSTAGQVYEKILQNAHHHAYKFELLRYVHDCVCLTAPQRSRRLHGFQFIDREMTLMTRPLSSPQQ